MPGKGLVATSLYEKQKRSPDNYKLIHHSIPVTTSIQLPEIPEGHQTPPDTSSSSPKLQWLPCLALPVTSPRPETPTAQVRTGTANSTTWSYSFFHEQFCSLYSECPFIYKGKKKKCLLPSPGKCCSQITHHWVRKSNNYSPDRGMTLFAEVLYT